jgi:protein TonB
LRTFISGSPGGPLLLGARDAFSTGPLSVYRLPSPYERSPLSRRLSGFGLALAINLALLLVLMTLGILPPPGPKNSRGLVVDLIPASRSASENRAERTEVRQPRAEQEKPVPKAPRIILPAVKPTIVPPQQTPKSQPWVEMSKDQMAAADISNVRSAASGNEGDSEAVGRGPNGETLYAAEWAREPTNAELRGYLPPNPHDGYGLVACKTIPGDRVDDCVELGQYPLGSHLASAVRQAAWQFRVRPPRKNGKPMIGEWVSIRIDYSFSRGDGQ